MDSVNSTTFIKRPPCMTDTEEKFLYTKELLSGRIFLGCYQERRYVTALKEYRDVVIIHNEETDLQSDIDKIGKKWSNVKNIKWVGITGPESVDLPKAYCIWVKLTNLPFGYYWFQIKHVQLKEGEVLMHLKCIRKSQTLQPTCGASAFGKCSAQNKNENSEPASTIQPKLTEVDWKLAKEAVTTVTKTCKDGVHVIKPLLTVGNIFHVLKVACALTIAIVMGTISFIGHFGEYILKLIRELSILVQAFTPILIHLIDFCSKIIGGFFILIAGLMGRNVYRPVPQSQAPRNLYSLNLSQSPPINWRERNRILRKELLSDNFKRR